MDIKKILDDHKLWVETNGKGGNRANLKGAYLERAYLERAYLERAYLEGAYLYGANLKGAYLDGANLYGANLEGANLKGAGLEGANLHGANLVGANLERANLVGADLRGARGILQWQAPQGEKRICYSVKAEDCVMHKLGCFWGATDEAVEAIRKKYGEGSLYEKFLLMQAEALGGE